MLLVMENCVFLTADGIRNLHVRYNRNGLHRVQYFKGNPKRLWRKQRIRCMRLSIRLAANHSLPSRRIFCCIHLDAVMW